MADAITMRHISFLPSSTRQEQTMQTQETIQPTAKRTPYRTPKLQRYGQLASLTAGGATVATAIEDSTITFSVN